MSVQKFERMNEEQQNATKYIIKVLLEYLNVI